MKRIAKTFLLIFLLFLLMLLIGYFLLAYYYREGFGLNTWINGVYCTGKTVDEVNAELLSKTETPILMITGRDGDSIAIDLTQIGYQEDFYASLNQYKEEQKPWRWIDNILFDKKYELTPGVTYDEELLREAFNGLEMIQREGQRPMDYKLENSRNGYYLYDGLSSRMDIEKVYQAVKEAVETGESALDLRDGDYYYDMPLSEEQKELKVLSERLAAFQSCNIVYDMGDETIPLDAGTMSRFLTVKEHAGQFEVATDENGEFVLKEAAVVAFVAELAEEYDTYGKEREFQSTRGDIITVEGVTYGTKLNQEAEVTYLMEHLLLGESHTDEQQFHIPTYEHEGVVRGRDDIGTTYIEIDMTEQKMYYYRDGELALETDVVTGNTSRRWGTPEGVNYVYAKQKDRVLRGEGYASPVKYWMPVKGNIGIHDANWRDEFGGTIYQRSGSHGCINTPTEKMAELYDMVEIGTPVVMFY